MTTPARKVLVLGGPDAGKTTLLVQLHGRVSDGTGAVVARGAPKSLGPIEAGYKRLQQGKPVAHTSHGTDVTLDLPAVDRSGRDVDIVVPDYAGEDLRRVVAERRIPDRWRSQAAAADTWLLLIRLAAHAELPDVLTKPIGDLARVALDDPAGEPDVLPVDMWAVELLQALLYSRRRDGSTTLPTLSLVLSCWDELDDKEQAAAPSDVAAARLALLHSYCGATWGDRYRALGLSAQGCVLTEQAPSEDYLDRGPQQMGWLIDAAGRRDSDLTMLVDFP